MQEEWKPVVGFEDRYLVSNCGQVQMLGRWIAVGHGGKRWLAAKTKVPQETTRGYLETTFKVGRRDKHFLIHRLVALAFLPNPNGLPQVNHKDGDKLNNHASNLEWCSSKENCDHARREKLYEQARGQGAGGAKLTDLQVIEIRSRLAAGETHTAIALDYPVQRTVISRIASGTRWASVR